VPFAANPAAAPQPTGPVDFVPGLPGAGTPPPPPVPPAAPAHAPAAASQPAPAVDASGPATSWPETLEDQLLAAGHGTKKKKKRLARGELHRTALAGVALAALSVILLELGLTLGFGGRSYWSAVTLWSAFATVAAVLGLLALAAVHLATDRLPSGLASRVAAVGLAGLAVFWLLVVLPHVATDRGFLLTAALGSLGAALWLGTRTKG
jgi:hypothetical protein